MAESDKSGQSDPGSILELDPRGDLILAIQQDDGTLHKKVLCCVRVLELSSSVFATMFLSKFKEGTKLQEQTRPIIELKEEFPEAMVKMLSFLHFHLLKSPSEPPDLAALAVQADKYNCSHSLGAWAERETWRIMERNPVVPGHNMGGLLTAATLLKFQQPYDVLEFAVKNIPWCFLPGGENPEWKYVPDVVRYSLEIEQRSMLMNLHMEIASVEKALRLEDQNDVHPCNSRALTLGVPSQSCTPQSRMTAYFTAMEKHDLWPSISEYDSPTDAWLKMESARLSLSHRCHHKECPLSKQMSLLRERFRVTIDDCSLFEYHLTSLTRAPLPAPWG